MSQTDFFGYFETETDQMRSRGTDYSFGYNKVRLDLEVSPLEEAIFRANFNYQIYHGQQRWDLFDFLPLRVTAPLTNVGMSEFPFLLGDSLYLDNAYLKVRFSLFDLTVGKQQLSLGTGYIWNPLDIFNRKQLLDPTYEQTGVEAIRVEVPLAHRFLLDIIVSPRDDWGASTKLIRGKVGVGRFDITATVGSLLRSRTGFDLTAFQPEVIDQRRQMIGWATVGEVMGWGVWTEGSLNSIDGDEDFAEFLLGLDHTFDFSTYLIVEFYHNGSGVLKKKEVMLQDYFSYFLGETHSLMQDYLFMLGNHPMTDLLTLGFFGLANLNDKSAIISPQIDYSLFENISVSLLVSTGHGDEDSEFGLQDWGVRLRMRVYF